MDDYLQRRSTIAIRNKIIFKYLSNQNNNLTKMKKLFRLCLLLSISISGIIHSTINGQDVTLPWNYLFDGKNLNNFSYAGDRVRPWVENGELVFHMVANTPRHSYVKTLEKYDDFILETECKIDGDVPTGILFRTIDAPDTSAISLYGYQVKIDPTPRKWTGGIFENYKVPVTWLYDLSGDEKAREAFKIGEWNLFRIEAIGPSIKVWVNGIPTVNLINSKYKDGYIAFQIHGLKDFPDKEKILVHYRSIKIITVNPEKYSRKSGAPLKRVDLE